jgi:hypothetical protein
VDGDSGLKAAEIVVSILGGFVGTLLLIVPGFILGAVFVKGVRGPSLSEKAFLAATAIGSVLVHLLMLFWTVPLVRSVLEDGPDGHVIEIALWSLTVLIVVPVCLGALLGWLSDITEPRWVYRLLVVVGLSSSVRTTEAWNFVFRQEFSAWVRVTLKGGKVILGWYGSRSAASQDAAAPDLYLQETYVAKDGKFGERFPRTRGVWVRGDEIASIEFFER